MERQQRVLWANLDLETYEAFAEPLHFWVNEVGMVFFFALAAKEVFEATLPGGALASLRQALSPLAAAVGGMVAPAAIYTSLALTLGPASLTRGWAIPCATDIAFSAMVARLIFPKGHPAIPFLLLLAIADDALGLLILAVFYPSATVSLTWLFLLLAAAMLLAVVLRCRRVRSFWPYVAVLRDRRISRWCGLGRNQDGSALELRCRADRAGGFPVASGRSGGSRVVIHHLDASVAELS